jgi:putative FmdB family regulatory protein
LTIEKVKIPVSMLSPTVDPAQLGFDDTSELEPRSSRVPTSCFISLLGRRCFMPMYDYKCLDCGEESLLALTLEQHESNRVTCRKCGSKKMQQLYTSFVAHTTKKS